MDLMDRLARNGEMMAAAYAKRLSSDESRQVLALASLLAGIPAAKRRRLCSRALRLVAREMGEPRVCVRCGNAVERSTRADRKYCSDSCRVMASRERKATDGH